MSSAAELVLTPPETVVLVVDVQERVCADRADETASGVVGCCRLLEGARLLGVPVVLSTLDPTSRGATAAPLLPWLARFRAMPPTFPRVELIVTRDDQLARHLDSLAERGVRTAVVAGIEAHVAVYQAVRGLVGRGMRVHVATDATASRDPRRLEIARGLWSHAGAVVSCVETVLFDLAASSGGDARDRIERLLHHRRDPEGPR